MWDQDKYQKAVAFAGYAHRDQTVPGREYNYTVHICSVAAEVARALFAENIGDADLAIQCALLHDVVEDTDTDPEMIRRDFGEDVFKGVLALTKDINIDKDRRMADSLRRIKAAGSEIACVKMADRITNLQKPPGYWSGEKKLDYLDEALLIYNELKEYSPYLGERLLRKIEEFRKYYGEK